MDKLLDEYLGRRRGLLKALTDDICELHEACCPSDDDDDGEEPTTTCGPASSSSPRLLSGRGDGSWAVLPAAAAAASTPPLLLSAAPPGALVPPPPPRPNAGACPHAANSLAQLFEAQRRWALAMAAHADAWLASSAALALAAAGATATERAAFHVRALRHPSVFEVVSGTAGPEDVHDLVAAAAMRLAGEEALAEEVGVPREVALGALAVRQGGAIAPAIGPRPSSSRPRVA